VRVGLNSAESVRDGSDYSGTAVTVAARIADKARGGQILVSEVKEHAAMLIEWLKEKDPTLAKHFEEHD